MTNNTAFEPKKLLCCFFYWVRILKYLFFVEG
jgi:hypothetical protein